MSVTYPPQAAPPPRKKGLGCLGCGCLALVLLFLGFIGLVGAGGYMLYKQAVGLTTTTPGSVPAYTATDDVTQSVRQKIGAFSHDLQNHQPSEIQLSGDEINNLLASDPDLTRNNVQAFVTLTDDKGRVQACVPTDSFTKGIIRGRYLNVDTTFTLSLDPTNHNVVVTPQVLQLGPQALIGPDAVTTGNSFAAGFNRGFAPSFVVSFNQSFNNGLKQNPGGRELLEHAKTIEIRNGMLVIDTE